MGIGTKLSSLMDANGTNANELAKKIGVSPQTIYSIIKRDSKKADIEVLLKIADNFGVTAEYFVNEKKPASSNFNDDKYTENVKKHMEEYSLLDPPGKKHVDTVLQWETERMKQLNVANAPAANPPMRLIQYYQRLASAGTGEVIFGDVPVDRIEIPDIPEYRRVSYAIGVNGHSMEPRYYDGDMLLIEPTCQIDVGEIGIFIVGDKAYVKKLGESELISLNIGYKNIPLTEDAKCMGRVIGKLDAAFEIPDGSLPDLEARASGDILKQA